MDLNQLLSMISAIRSGLDGLEKEINSAVPPTTEPAPLPQPQAGETNPVPTATPPVETAPADVPAPTVAPEVVDLTNPLRLQQESQEDLKRKQELERLQRAAGTYYLSKRVSVLDTHKQ